MWIRNWRMMPNIKKLFLLGKDGSHQGQRGGRPRAREQANRVREQHERVEGAERQEAARGPGGVRQRDATTSRANSCQSEEERRHIRRSAQHFRAHCARLGCRVRQMNSHKKSFSWLI